MVSVQDNVFSLWRGIVNSGSGYGRRKDDCEHIFEFESGKRFVVGASRYGNTGIDATAEFSLEGDRFFLFIITMLPINSYLFSALRYTITNHKRAAFCLMKRGNLIQIAPLYIFQFFFTTFCEKYACFRKLSPTLLTRFSGCAILEL